MGGFSAAVATLVAIGASLTVSTSPVPAQGAQGEDRGEIRIGLSDEGPFFAVDVSAAALTLELPEDARYPLDLVTASGGLLQSAEVRVAEDGAVRLVLRLGGTLLERVEVQGDQLVLGFVRKSRTESESAVEGGGYRIGIDDKLQIAVNGDPELTREVIVGPDGRISAPLVGDLAAAGLTTTELTARLASLLSRDFLVDPRVEVQIVEYRSQWVLVSGSVRIPGRVPLRGNAVLKDVLADAGGLSENAGEEIVISRTATDPSAPQRIRVDRQKFEAGFENPRLMHGDIVNVEEAAHCHVLGEVRAPNRIRVEPGLTLFRALSIVGGLTEWANAKEIQVIRADGTVESFDLKRIQKGEAEDPPIRGGDRIYVKRRFL